MPEEGLGLSPIPSSAVESEQTFHNRFSCVTGTNIHEVLCLVIVNVTKYVQQKCQKFVAIRCVLPSSRCTKTRFRPGLLVGELTTLPQIPSRLGRGTPAHTLPSRRLRRLELGASIPRPPPNKIPGHASSLWPLVTADGISNSNRLKIIRYSLHAYNSPIFVDRMLILNIANIYRSAVNTAVQRPLPINTQYSTYSKLMFKVSLPKISPCSPGRRWMAFRLRRAKVLG